MLAFLLVPANADVLATHPSPLTSRPSGFQLVPPKPLDVCAWNIIFFILYTLLLDASMTASMSSTLISVSMLLVNIALMVVVFADRRMTSLRTLHANILRRRDTARDGGVDGLDVIEVEMHGLDSGGGGGDRESIASEAVLGYRNPMHSGASEMTRESTSGAANRTSASASDADEQEKRRLRRQTKLQNSLMSANKNMDFSSAFARSDRSGGESEREHVDAV